MLVARVTIRPGRWSKRGRRRVWEAKGVQPVTQFHILIYQYVGTIRFNHAGNLVFAWGILSAHIYSYHDSSLTAAVCYILNCILIFQYVHNTANEDLCSFGSGIHSHEFKRSVWRHGRKSSWKQFESSVVYITPKAATLIWRWLIKRPEKPGILAGLSEHN